MKRFRTIALVALALAGGSALQTVNAGAATQNPEISAPSESVTAQGNADWRSKIGSRGGRVVLVLKDANGQRIHGANVTASVARRLGACLCRSLVLLEKKPGIYVAPSPLPAPGTWDIRVTAERQGKTYEATGSVTVD